MKTLSQNFFLAHVLYRPESQFWAVTPFCFTEGHIYSYNVDTWQAHVFGVDFQQKFGTVY